MRFDRLGSTFPPWLCAVAEKKLAPLGLVNEVENISVFDKTPTVKLHSYSRGVCVPFEIGKIYSRRLFYAVVPPCDEKRAIDGT